MKKTGALLSALPWTRASTWRTRGKNDEASVKKRRVGVAAPPVGVAWGMESGPTAEGRETPGRGKDGGDPYSPLRLAKEGGSPAGVSDSRERKERDGGRTSRGERRWPSREGMETLDAVVGLDAR